MRLNAEQVAEYEHKGYVVLPALAEVSDGPGVYHYAPREHALERCCVLGDAAPSPVVPGLPAGAFLAGLSSVHWPEARKYG